MVSWVDTNNCKHFSELKTPWDFRCSENSLFNTILAIFITTAGSESKELINNQSCNAIDLASTVNLRNPFPDRSASLVLGLWNS